MLRYSADFETTTTPEDVRVWASCCVNIDTLEVEQIGNDIESFLEFMQNKNCRCYFHNLKFDAEFLLSKLFSLGYECNDTKAPKTFTTLISDTGVFYNITIYFDKFNKRYHKCEIFDSMKKLPFSVAGVAAAWNG